MPSCSTSSNIRTSNTVISASEAGSRLTAQILSAQITPPGFSLGDAIYYDVSTSLYARSKADSAVTSEVFGVVESIDGSDNATVVIVGSIGLTGYVSVGDGGAGGSDVYFLSGMTAGKLQNQAPSDSDHIVKAVYQVAPHASAYTGIIVNYIGYKAQATS
jgi:hypothetical protein